MDYFASLDNFATLATRSTVIACVIFSLWVCGQALRLNFFLPRMGSARYVTYFTIPWLILEIVVVASLLAGDAGQSTAGWVRPLAGATIAGSFLGLSWIIQLLARENRHLREYRAKIEIRDEMSAIAADLARHLYVPVLKQADLPEETDVDS